MKSKSLCWARFLSARADVIDWLKEDHKYDDEKISKSLSTDPTQIFLIRTRNRDHDHLKIMDEKE